PRLLCRQALCAMGLRPGGRTGDRPRAQGRRSGCDPTTSEFAHFPASDQVSAPSADCSHAPALRRKSITGGAIDAIALHCDSRPTPIDAPRHPDWQDSSALWWALRDLNPQPKDSSWRAFRHSLDYVTTHGLTRCG